MIVAFCLNRSRGIKEKASYISDIQGFLEFGQFSVHPLFLTRRAENGTRTRDLNLGKVALYQLSYFRIHDRSLADCECKGSEKMSISKFFDLILQFFYNSIQITPYDGSCRPCFHAGRSFPTKRNPTDPLSEYTGSFVDKIRRFVQFNCTPAA